MGGRGVATAGITHTTHASFLREPGGPDPLRPARRSIYPKVGRQMLVFKIWSLKVVPQKIKMVLPTNELVILKTKLILSPIDTKVF